MSSASQNGEAGPPHAGAHESARRVIVLVLAIIVIHQCGTGLLLGLVPLLIAAAGYPASVAGVVSTGFSIGFIAGCLGAPWLITRLGARRMMIAAMLVNAGAALLIWGSHSPFAWMLARAIAGLATATLFTVIEAWLAAQSTNANRGRVFAAYMVANRVTFSGAQLAFAWFDGPLQPLALVAIAAYLLSPLPLLAIRSDPPRTAAAARLDLMELPRIAPAAAATAFAHGLLTTSVPALFPILGLAEGLSVASVALSLAAIQLGGLLMQLVVMAISDRFDRRRQIVVLSVVIAALGIAMLAAFTPGPAWLMLAIVAIWGGVPNALYSLASAHANDLADDGQRVTWTSSMLLLWGIGAAVGPMIAALMMDVLGMRALFAFSALLGVGLASFVLWRIVARPG